MAFPRFLSTKEMAEYVVYRFEWDRHKVAFSPSHLPKDFQALCSSNELDVAEEAAGHFELPELPQVIFYAMLLNVAERLGVLHGHTLWVMESALIELRWSTFESCVWLNRHRIFKAQFWAKVEPKEESSRAGQQEEDSEAKQKD